MRVHDNTSKCRVHDRLSAMISAKPAGQGELSGLLFFFCQQENRRPIISPCPAGLTDIIADSLLS